MSTTVLTNLQTTGTLQVDGAATLASAAITGALTAATVATKRVVAAASADGAVAVGDKDVFITKAGVCAMTLASPTATTHDGVIMRFVAATANAHTLTITAGFNGGGASKDVATFGGAVGDTVAVEAYQGVWYILNSTNITLA